MNDQNLIGQISNCLVKGRFEACAQQRDSEEKSQLGVPELIRLSMKKNVPSSVVAKKALDDAMEESIKKYVDGEFTIPDMFIRAKSTARARDVLSRYAENCAPITRGKAILATIEGEDYSNWRKFTKIILKGLGYKTIDLGSGVPADDLIESVKSEDPDILGITPSSASLVPEFNVVSSMSSKAMIKRIIDNLSDEGCCEDVTILISGNIPGIHTAADVGADYCCKNMFQTIELLGEIATSSN